MLDNKSKKDFETWLVLQPIAPYKVMIWDTPKAIQMCYIVKWFDEVGITTDVIPRISVDKTLVFEANTFCLLHEEFNEEFIQFDDRFDAISESIKQGCVIYNKYF